MSSRQIELASNQCKLNCNYLLISHSVFLSDQLYTAQCISTSKSASIHIHYPTVQQYTPCTIPNSIPQAADMPYALYQSLQGKYFVGFAADVQFTTCRYGWAGLVNPTHSCVNLHVYVWTVTNFGEYPLSAEIWFNTDTPEDAEKSDFITPANTAICPLLRPKVGIHQANNVNGGPTYDNSIFVKKVLP